MIQRVGSIYLGRRCSQGRKMACYLGFESSPKRGDSVCAIRSKSLHPGVCPCPSALSRLQSPRGTVCVSVCERCQLPESITTKKWHRVQRNPTRNTTVQLDRTGRSSERLQEGSSPRREAQVLWARSPFTNRQAPSPQKGWGLHHHNSFSAILPKQSVTLVVIPT